MVDFVQEVTKKMSLSLVSMDCLSISFSYFMHIFFKVLNVFFSREFPIIVSVSGSVMLYNCPFI